MPKEQDLIERRVLPKFNWEALHINLLNSKMNLTKTDYLNLENCGITRETVSIQIEKLRNGPEALHIKDACVLNDGIIALNSGEKKRLIDQFEGRVANVQVTMFTPASGAATRMFKHLINPISDVKLYQGFLDNITRFAFFQKMEISHTNEETIAFLLNKEGLNYAQLPKAMIPFHKYDGEIRNAIDDQIIEGLFYLNLGKGFTFHFTISPAHEKIVKAHLEAILPDLEHRFQTPINVEFSFQEKHTETIALTEKGDLVRNEKNEVLTRPGGHGALIHNLNTIKSDLIFVKNIDNIAREEYHPEVIAYKKVIGSYLLEKQHQVFKMLIELDSDVSQIRCNEISNWLKTNLKQRVNANRKDLKNALNRPIRVCGMVKNEGKAGGGPFWVGNQVQIVESAQMDVNNLEIQKILKRASHFNPVDVVCGVKDYLGEKFDLTEYVDESTFFVSQKSYQGQNIKVLEHPGLWNGAMANWLTFFVEVPVVTFNPVKNVNDLLLKEHCKEI
ncbi:MAG: hypothetical protein ACI8SA_001445 [Dokdonia sp.]